MKYTSDAYESLDVDFTCDLKIFGINNRFQRLFEFSICSSTAYCCGMKEIGGVCIVRGDYNELDKPEFTKQLDSAVTELYKNNTDLEDGCYKLMANLIDSDACNLLRDSFIRTGLFEKQFSFKNQNTGNIIDTWFSV